MEIILQLQKERQNACNEDKLIDAITDVVESKGYYVEKFELPDIRDSGTVAVL